MHIFKKFTRWWKENNCSSPLTTLPEAFDGGWSVGFNEASKIGNMREKLILEALRPDLPEDFSLDNVIMDTLEEATEPIVKD